jgi:GT2 family glycosyltransferase
LPARKTKSSAHPPAVSILALGSVGYGLAAREAAASVLQHSDFDVFVTCDEATRPLFSQHSRLKLIAHEAPPSSFKPARFLAKFDALAACLAATDAELILHLDADAVLQQRIDAAMVEAALGDADIAMAEQPRILGSTLGRGELRQHFIDHAIPFFAPHVQAPPLDRFCFANAGVVLFRRAGLQAFLNWARPLAASLPAEHRQGGHWIADQDYLQVWANNLNAQGFVTLPWQWNHCEHWDEGFPRVGALIAHLSNFMDGPSPETISRLRALRGRQKAAGSIIGKNQNSITFVIVTFNSAAWLDLCLEAAEPLGQIIIVDNASTDASVAIAERHGATALRNGRNLGFAAAANLGAHAAATPFVCFLNPDCLVTPATVAAAGSALAHDPRQLLVPDFADWSGRRESGLQPGYTRLKIMADLLDTRAPKHARRIRKLTGLDDQSWNWPHGACVFAAKDVFLSLGGFDEKYFCYMEDVELGRAAAAVGVAVNALPQAVLHVGQHGATVAPARRHALMDAARFQYARRHYGLAFALLAESIARLAGFIRKPFKRRPGKVSGKDVGEVPAKQDQAKTVRA